MNKCIIRILFLFFTALLFVNNSNALEYCRSISYPPNDTVYYCYITDIYNKGGENFVQIRPVQFLWGLSAVIEARKDSAAEYDIDKDTKDTNWYVPNDYYISAKNKTEFKFIISDKVKVTIYNQAELKKITVKELQLNPSYYKLQLYDRYTHEKKEELDYYPYEIAFERGKVTVIQEVYIP